MATRMSFTKARLAAINPDPAGKRIYLRDEIESALHLLVTPAGVKSFLVYAWANGKPRRVTLGRFEPERKGSLTIEQARKRAIRELAKLKDGIDVNAEKRSAREAPTVGDLADEYLERWARPRKRSAGEDERILNRDVLPAWKRRKAAEVTRHDVLTLLDSIVDRGSPIMANRTLQLVRKMFAFGVERGIVATSPCVAIRAPAKEHRRERLLTEPDIRKLWRALERYDGDKAPAMSATVRLALQLILATAQRPGECRTLEWADLDLKGGWWTIPAEKSKNGLAHRVPLNKPALTILERAKVISDGKTYVFPGPRADKPMLAASLPHSVRVNADLLGVADAFTPHDLRRTAASWMTSAGTSRVVVGKILNHAEPGVTAVYDRNSYDQEKARAMAQWGRRLVQIVEGKAPSKVTALQAHA